MPDKVTHQYINDVIVHRDHSYTNHSYSKDWLIATSRRCKLSS
jgi:hypothetical protein